MDPTPHVELSKDGRPLVTEFDEFASRHMVLAVTLLSYFLPLALGTLLDGFFLGLPIVKIAGFIFGIGAITIAAFPAIFFIGLVCGNLSFEKQIVGLYAEADFIAAIGLIAFVFPAAMFGIRTIDRTMTTYDSRKGLFCLSVALTFICFWAVVIHSGYQSSGGALLFTFLIAGAIHFYLLRRISRARRTGFKP